jgi:hypothetical protein
MEILTKQTRNKLVDQIAGLRVDVKALKREREQVGEELGLTDQIASLKRQIADLEIGKAKLEEDNARKIREVTHQVGLQRKRQDFEVSSAKRDTALEVREANLAAERDRFERDMTFQREELTRQVDYLKGLMERVLERLPDVSMAVKHDLARTRNGDGDES